MCKIRKKIFQLHNGETSQEGICSFLWSFVRDLITSYSFFFLTEVLLFSMEECWAFAHWSKIFKYLILSQIIVLPGKLNVSMRDGFTHFYSWLHSIERNHEGLGQQIIACMPRKVSYDTPMTTWRKYVLSITQNTKEKLRTQNSQRISEMRCRYCIQGTIHSIWHHMQ